MNPTPRLEMLFRTFFALIALAICGAAVATFAANIPGAVASVLVLAFLKARLLVLDFMAMRDRPGVLSFTLFLWAGLLLTMALARSLILPAFT